MSHLVNIGLIVDDLSTLATTTREFGGVLLQCGPGQPGKMRWYGQHMADSGIPEGFTAETFSAPLAVLDFAQAKIRYTVGVFRNPAGKGYVLLWDTFGIREAVWAGQDNHHDGQALTALLGTTGGKLKQAYALNRAEALARKQGFRNVQRVAGKNGVIKLVCQ